MSHPSYFMRINPNSIRLAVPADARGIAGVHVEAWRAAYRGLLPDSVLDSLSLAERERIWAELLAAGEETTYVAESGCSVVGFVTVGANRDGDCESPDFGEIHAVYLASEVWRQGLGRTLCEEGLARLRSLGHTVVTVWVLQGNQRARRFYEALGFRTDSATKPCQIPDCDELEVRYRIDL